MYIVQPLFVIIIWCAMENVNFESVLHFLTQIVLVNIEAMLYRVECDATGCAYFE